ncbi:Glucanosyltransferase-domain-containing protein [Massariosphaeria phaeospora]|uniref:1,3-beta-glucanosyltransferase n=1 Tax=Massariosphaeria phaeospora TaxID=100035 RepID=A0A7C8M880_9PLEO|nr:Glucanosyltransferase-domain-containing protein [Massariosphaeria phaeospora]
MASVIRFSALLVGLFAAIASAVHPVDVRGQEFVDTVTNKRVMIIGADYQPGGQAGYGDGKDALSDGAVCLRDAALLQRLGANTIRVYNVDPTLNHDECASIFNAVGIYMIIDVNSPFGGESLNRDEPWTSYHKEYLARIFGVVENFKGYPNTMAFFAANEVMNDLKTAQENPKYIRAVQRDLKNYIKKHSDRPIPVGYSAADVREILEDTWAYFQCDHDDDQSRSDFFGLNSYSWCGNQATFNTAGYDVLAKMFKESAIPVFFSEYGCNEIMPRGFNEVQALYGKEMSALSGGLVYEYSQEESNYGLVEIEKNGTVTLRPDFDNLQAQFNKLDIALVQSADPSSTSIKAPKCDAKLISAKEFSKNFTIPAEPPGAKDLINNGIKNPKRGKIINVSETKVAMAVYGTSGEAIKDLSIRKLTNDDSNTPNGETTSPPESPAAAGQAAPSSSPKPESAASKLTGGWTLLFAVFAAVLTVL